MHLMYITTGIMVWDDQLLTHRSAFAATFKVWPEFARLWRSVKVCLQHEACFDINV